MRRAHFLLTLVCALAMPGIASADPILTAVTLFAINAGATVGTALAIAEFVTFVVLPNIALAVVSKLAAAQRPSNSRERQASVATMQLGEAPREFLFGECATAGQLIDAFNSGGDYGTTHECIVVALADHRCHSLVGFYIGDDYFAFAGNGVQPGFNGKLTVYFHDGSVGQAASGAIIDNAGGRWTSADRLAGMAYVIAFYAADHAGDADNPTWPAGRPNFLWRVKGAFLYDPRKDGTVAGGVDGAAPHRWSNPATWEWSDNAYLARYAFARGIYADGRVDDPELLWIGRGLTAEQAPPERAIARANLCDELVALKGGGSEPRYRASGVVRADEPFIRVEEMFSAAMAGSITQPGGGVEVEPGVAKSAVRSFTDADLPVGLPVRVEHFVGQAERVNTVLPRYTSPAQLWRDVAAPIRRSSTDVLVEGPLAKTIGLSLVTSHTQAQRIGEIERRLGRLEIRATLTLGPRFSNLEEGDWITWTSDRHFAGATVTFRVEAQEVDAAYRIKLVLRQVAASCYAWTAATDEGTPGEAPVDEPSTLAPLTLAGVNIVKTMLATVGGDATPAVRASWTTPVDSAVQAVRLEIRMAGQVELTPTVQTNVGAGVLVTTNGVPSAGAIEARLTPVGTEGRRSTPSEWFEIVTDRLSLQEIGELQVDMQTAILDGHLTPGEKLFTVPALQALVGARTALRATAAAYGLTVGTSAILANYEARATQIDGVLATLTTPVAWSDSSDVTEIPDPVAFRQAVFQAAQAERDLQSALHGAAQAAIAAAATDGVLSPSEKLGLVPQIKGMIAARAKTRAQADALSLTVALGFPSRIGYEAAQDDLDALLAALTAPVAWDNLTGSTTIADRATFVGTLTDALGYEGQLNADIGATYAVKITDINQDVIDLAALALGDGVLTSAEKLTVKPMINAVLQARAALRTQADARGLTTGASAVRATFESKATALDSYLATLTTPVAWNVTGQTTIASPSTFSTTLQEAIQSERDLQTAIDASPALTIVNQGPLATAPNAVATLQYLDSNGQFSDWRGFGNPNGAAGMGAVFDVNPLTADDRYCYIAAFNLKGQSYARACSSGVLDFGAANTTYGVVMHWAGGYYGFIYVDDIDLYVSAGGWLYLGTVKTSSGGVFTPPTSIYDGYIPDFGGVSGGVIP